MKNFGIILLLCGLHFGANAQNQGDTIIVKTFNYSQTYGINQWSAGIRDTMIGFPTDTSLSYEKILMRYNIRCKGAKVSPAVSGQTDIGCGEWDASCNTYITDSSRVDSVLSFTSSHLISNFSGIIFPFVTSPMNDLYRHFQKEVIIDSIISDSIFNIGNSGIGNTSFIPTGSKNTKTQYLFTQGELAAAGLTAGNIYGINLQSTNANGYEQYLRIRLKHSNAGTLTDSLPDNSGFNEVYFHDFQFTTGANRVQFYTPFFWDGVSNIIVETSYSNNNSNTTNLFPSSIPSFVSAIQSVDDNSLYFNASNYVQADAYKGIPGNQLRTIEAWIKTNVPGMDIISWGANVSGKKWIFKLHSNGGLRVEINGGSVYGTTNVANNQWHHVAMVMNGPNINNIQFYVDGVLETNLTIANLAINSDTVNGINLVLSQGFHNRFWTGNIDELRVWSAALNQNTLKKWMYSVLDTNHLNYSNLELYYNFDENDGAIVHDFSPHQRHATIYGNNLWSSLKGIQLFKAYKNIEYRPQIGFIHGNHLLTISTDTVLDTLPRFGNNVKAYQIIDNSGTMLSDLVQIVMDTVLWKSGFEYIIDPISELKMDSTLRMSDGVITISTLDYYKRYPMKYEIMSFVTPYGINLDLGPNGKTWTFDVTDFEPILKGTKRMTVERGGQWMEDMDIQFLFIVGTPPRPVIDIHQLWKVDSRSYTDIMSDKAFELRSFKTNLVGKAFKVRSAITGHGQEGEFISQNHTFDIDGGSIEFSWPVWKTCSNNPIYPQGGTWIYSRAGWCPGAPTNLKEMDITSYIIPGQTHSFNYSVNSASGTSNYIVNNQLVTYGNPNFTLDAAVVDISSPTEKVEYSRENMICNSPTIIIQNIGTSLLTSATIKYWVNNNASQNTFNWTGSLAFLEKIEISLPADSALWSGIIPLNNKFHVRIENPNGGTDQYSPNNSYHADFKIPDVIPSDFIILLYTNKSPQETSYKLYDSDGNIIFHKTGLTAQKLNKDTFNLPIGCYKLEILDSGGDGLSFFANSDGNGYINIRRLNNSILKSFNPDFGSKTVYNFTIDYPLEYDELFPPTEALIYPNPSEGLFTVDFGDQRPQAIMVTDALGRLIKKEKIENGALKTIKLDLTGQPRGIYFVLLQYGNKTNHFKVVKD